jgi:5-methylcytosine-specific restriction endonuclease McrA
MAYIYVPHEGPIVTRAEAKASGLTRYFTGRPCPQGHISERWIASYSCDACQRIDTRQRYEANLHGRQDGNRAKASEAYYSDIEKSREYHRLRSALLYEARKPYMASWQAANREHLNAYSRARFAELVGPAREKRRVLTRRRRARRKGNGGSHTAEQIQAMLASQQFRCANCKASIKKGYHADHIQPINAGGSNDISNIQLLCARCNLSKGHKDPIRWARSQGRLL